MENTLQLLLDRINAHIKKKNCHTLPIKWCDLKWMLEEIIEEQMQEGPDEGDGPDWE